MTLDNMTGITEGSYTGFCKSQLITCNFVKACNGVCPFEDALKHADQMQTMNEQHTVDHDRDWIIGCIEHDGFIHTHRFDKANQIIHDALSAEAKPMTEEVREALMRLTMCAREDCVICKYKDKCNFDFQYEESTKNMNTILDSLMRSKCEVDAKWIPCSERLPEDIRPVLVTWKNNAPASYYQYIVGKHFIGTAHYYRGKWYWYSSVTEDLLAEYGKCDTEEFDEAIEAVAWMPLPKPYKGGDDE